MATVDYHVELLDPANRVYKTFRDHDPDRAQRKWSAQRASAGRGHVVRLVEVTGTRRRVVHSHHAR